MDQKTQNQERAIKMQALITCRTRDDFLQTLRAYILWRLNLPEETLEDSLYQLVVFSVKLRMPGVNVQQLQERLATTDCHQTSYVVSKKALLMMEIERGLGVKLSSVSVDKSETVVDYAAVLWEAMEHEPSYS